MKQYVNVYLQDRAYGGPEEGGWWYDTHDVCHLNLGEATDDNAIELSFLVHDEDEAQVLKKLIQPWCDKENGERRSDISSVLSEGKFVVYVENHPAVNQPEVHPHYE